MKKLLLSALGAALFSFTSFGQTTLFQDDFESGTSNWSFNGSGDNAWIVNNVYSGGGFVTDTPNQPGGNTNYMHIMSGLGCSFLNACNANFDTGSASLQNADLATGVDASGASSVSLEFWYLCAGSTGVSYGSVYVSVDGGTTWNNVATYSNVSVWTQETLDITSIAAGQSNVIVRFQWQNGGGGNDPAFAVDDVVIAAMMGGGGSNAISTTNDVSPAAWCEGTTSSVTVNFTATGTYTAGNVYTAEISDATGSFAAPTAIGNLSSTASGALTIPCTVPGTLPAGTGYRIRVLSTNPSVTGSDNGTDLVISTAPAVTQDPFTQVCVYDQLFALTGGTPAGGTYTGPGVVAGAFDPATAGIGTHTIVYTYTDGTGCSNTAQQALVVDACASISEEETEELTMYPNPTSGQLNISGGDYDHLSVMDLSGRKVFESKKLASNKYDLSDVPTGVYLVKVISDKTEKTFRLIKK
ncbi:MAG: T9SS type A sorting domain-containing protein [Crocinitomicaceae bacterium]